MPARASAHAMLADICEAVIGAVFLDGGYPAAAAQSSSSWTERMHKPRRPLRDPKTVLQEWAQGKGLPTPSIAKSSAPGRITTRSSAFAVELPELAPAEGTGGTKRAAEQAAASAMIAREGVGGGNA